MTFFWLAYSVYVFTVALAFRTVQTQDRESGTSTAMSTATNLMLSLIPILNIALIFTELKEAKDNGYDSTETTEL